MSKGPCTYDVRTEGGGGFKNCPILRTDKTDRLREMRTRGRGGLKSRKFRGRHMYMAPYDFGVGQCPRVDEFARTISFRGWVYTYERYIS